MTDLSQFKDIFISEAEDHLQALNDNLLKLEKNIKKNNGGLNEKDKKILNELMRSSHTIKGSSATMEYKKMAYLAHILEDVFDYARNDIISLTPKIINFIYEGVDKLENSLVSIKNKDKEINLDAFSKKIKKITGVQVEGIGKSKRTKDGKPIIVKKKKGKKNTVKAKKEKRKENKDDLNEKENDIDSQDNNTKEVSFIKVPVQRLDDLLEAVEMIAVDKMHLEEVVRKTIKHIDRDVENDNKISGSSYEKVGNNLKKTTEHISKLLSKLQNQVMKVRLVSIGQVFARYPRMVRDLSKSKNKTIELEIEDGNLELDRTVIDKLNEPLVHLIRNAIDHGIKKKGKIYLKAKREKDRAIIIVENSGNNIDVEKIKKAAIKRKILSKSEINLLNKDQIINLIFNPQLSTKEKVTETSGRGVGLSVVKSFVEKLNGQVVVESNLKGGGTRFYLNLPLTLAIFNTLLVKSADNIFAIPFSVIERTVLINEKELKSMTDQDVMILGDQSIPLVFLDKILGLDKTEKNKNTTKSIILFKNINELAGLVVDELLNEQEIIVKSLPPTLRGVKGFSGSTILGSGKTILILDVFSLLENKDKLIRT